MAPVFRQNLPNMKENIRSLTLIQTMFGFLVPEERTEAIENDRGDASPKGFWGRQLQKVFGLSYQTRKQLKELEVVRYLDRFIGNLRCVTELTINSHFNHALVPRSGCSLIFLDTSWRAFGPNLRRLALKGDVSLLEAVLQEAVYLVQLECLSVQIGRNRHGGDMGAALSALAKFTRRHSSTLNTLTIVSDDVVDFDVLNQGIGRLPRLQTLKVRQPPSGTSQHDRAARQFLLRHIDTITDLDWAFADVLLKEGFHHWVDGADPLIPFNLKIPNIRSLAVGYVCPQSIRLTSVISFISCHQRSLTKLSLAFWMLSLDQFTLLVHGTASPILKELEISIATLTSRMFATLSICFPRLEILGLTYDKAGRQLGVTSTQGHSTPILATERLEGVRVAHGLSEFAEDMGKLWFGDWPVEALNIRKCFCSEWQGYRVGSVGGVLLASLPRVGFVNRMYREEFLSVMPGKEFEIVISRLF
ncbi:hypothetical protein P691DRAFT_776155 [Macrolepiota fuliginosa MF-IS2]|uniref:Uncharacterized protein n=1 Tax=Macrolepiota fuliginosa MF-IS2 TaxID=1400762 RepID=A0A9P5XCM8_9AGAR|nr:hypothetical protein P691DRAFT_776155 [Macrolepiota fuliginosa MF-IS2]